MKHTPLTQIHLAANARMADFAGYNMPISYTNISEEHHAVRQRVGLFDVSHMGEFIVKGKEALHLVQKLVSNDASKLKQGQAMYAYLPNEHGGIVDDLLVYRLFEDMCADDEEAFMLVVNASNIEKDWAWIHQHNTFDSRVIDISSQTGLIALQGPKAAEVLASLTPMNVLDMAYYHFSKGEVAGIDNVIISATGYTGSGGFELYVNSAHTEQLWNALYQAGQQHNIALCGLGARDTLRLEMGFCLYGNDIDDNTSPIEAGLGWITKLKKEGGFIGIDQIIKIKEKGLQKKLVGFIMEERRVPRHGYDICDKADNVIGRVTSGTQSPTLDVPIGMGYVDIDFALESTPIYIKMGKKNLPASIVSLPFYKK